jgi:hypothetical protein
MVYTPLVAGKERKKMAFTNRYAGKCGKCGAGVPAGAGLCERVNGKFTAFHKSCGAGPVFAAPVSTVFRTSGGTFYQNAKGRCEDAPCCGCCNC